MPTRICIVCNHPFEAITCAKLCDTCKYVTIHCEWCNKEFTRRYRPYQGLPRFCSVRCRNQHIATSNILVSESCPICGESFKPFLSKGRRQTYCSQNCAHEARARQNQQRRAPLEKAIKERYAKEGSDGLASEFGVTITRVQQLASRLGISLDSEVYYARVHEAARQFMSASNPMKNKETVEKVRRYYENHPEAKRQRNTHMLEAKAKQQRDKPNKLEQKLHSILKELGVEFEIQMVIKPKFIVDVRIGNLIIQADGDYWHGHPRLKPLSNRQCAQQKRDCAQDKYLSTCGYTVVRIWENDMSIDAVRAILRQNHIPLLT